MSTGISSIVRTAKPIPGGGKELWNAEYGLHKAIPSSSRMSASKPFLLYERLLEYDKAATVLDAGCGLGRNSIYMAKKGAAVKAVDYSDIALSQLRKHVEGSEISRRIDIVDRTLDDSFPYEDEAFDLVIDSYVSCHFTEDDFRERYLNELYRVTKSGGVVFSSAFSFADEYYMTLQKQASTPGNLVTDPTNGITKRLFEPEEIKGYFARMFEIQYFSHLEFLDKVLGMHFRRGIFAIGLRK